MTGLLTMLTLALHWTGRAGEARVRDMAATHSNQHYCALQSSEVDSLHKTETPARQ